MYKSWEYSIPKIHKPKTGRWYIYYFYEHPEDKDGYGRLKRVRFNCPSLELNAKYKKRNEREEHFNALRDTVEILLRKGYNPFGTYQKMERKHTAEDAIDYVLEMKKVTVSKSTYSG